MTTKPAILIMALRHCLYNKCATQESMKIVQDEIIECWHELDACTKMVIDADIRNAIETDNEIIPRPWANVINQGVYHDQM